MAESPLDSNSRCHCNEGGQIIGSMEITRCRWSTAVSLVYGSWRISILTWFFTFLIAYKEVYGMLVQKKEVRYAARARVKMIIALDAGGSRAIEKVALANNWVILSFVDIILQASFARGYCSLGISKEVDCLHPYKELSGCGVRISNWFKHLPK